MIKHDNPLRAGDRVQFKNQLISPSVLHTLPLVIPVGAMATVRTLRYTDPNVTQVILDDGGYQTWVHRMHLELVEVGPAEPVIALTALRLLENLVKTLPMSGDQEAEVERYLKPLWTKLLTGEELTEKLARLTGSTGVQMGNGNIQANTFNN